MKTSKKWKNWISIMDPKICKQCKENHGKIYEISEKITPSPPLHPNCRCTIQRLKSLFAGEATNKGTDGADWHLKYNGKLPNYYISKTEALKRGWKGSKRYVSDIAPALMIYGGIYENDDEILPQASKRIWYEADINYISGIRNSERIVFSNDGLIFVTYDHYKTFVEIR